jgi:outer membrane protein insertion porin family
MGPRKVNLRWLPVLLVIVLAGSLRVSAQEPAFEGKRIVAIDYTPAEQPLAPEDLKEAQTLKLGAPLRADDLGAAIDRLYATGRYDDIEVDAEPAAGGVTLRFITTLRQFVGHLGLTGKISVPPNGGQIQNTASLRLGQPYHPADLETALDNMRTMFERNGLYEVEVRPSATPTGRAQQVAFVFHIKPGKRAKYEEPVIDGNAVLPVKTIVKATGWKWKIVGWWKKVTESRTRGGIQGIVNEYGKNDRLMAQVQVRKMNYDAKNNRLEPMLHIDAGPKVVIKTVEAKVSKGKLKKYVPVYQAHRVDRDLLVEGARNLSDYFQTQGYYDVDVAFRGENRVVNGVTTIEYVISEGQRYKLVKVAIEGNKYFDAPTLRERMFLQPAGFLRFRHGRYSEAFRTRDEENIANLYKANGFRNVKVGSSVVRNYRGKPGDIAVTYHIQEGPQWFVDKLDISGVSKVSVDQVRGQLSSVAGQPYADYNVAADRTTILTQYYQQGFPDATFHWSSTPGAKPDHVVLHYVIHEGRQQFVRDVLIMGNHTTRMSLIQKDMTLQPGDPLSPLQMIDAQKNLYNRGVFADVETAIQNPDGETYHKYVLYDLHEAHRYDLNLGVGAEFARFGGLSTSANTLEAPAGTTGFSPRVSMDVSRLNLWGLGHVATVRGLWSTLEQQGSFSYLAPRFGNVEGRDITFTALYDDARYVNTFSSQREEASIQVSQKFSKPTTALFRFAYRRVSATNIVIPTLLVPQLLSPVRIGILSMNLSEDRRDNPAEPHHGIFNSFDVGVASHAFGSQRNFFRALGRNATYWSITRNVVLARQTIFGIIQPFSVPAGQDAADYIPLAERFFAGGSATDRGFPENEAGPRDIGTPAGPGASATQPTGFPLGGDAQFFNETELRFPLIGENIGGVLFHDFGNTFSSIGQMSFRVSQRNLQDFDYMVHAVGFGIRYRTPVGPIRLDFAYSINPPSFIGFKGTQQELLQCNPNPPPGQPNPPQCTGVRQSISHFQFFFSIGQTF